MTENPFGAEQFGQGGFDMNALLQQAQQMQEQLVSAQAKLAEAEVEGSAGSGVVTVRLSGAGDLQGVDIKAGSFAGDDADDLADLGDLVVAAWRDAKAKVDALAAETLGPLAGGGGLGGAGGGGDSLPGLGF
ncbi:YbaB/EbfC family nucleoid-associated protein [Nocardioides sp. JQ2195]|uniref:YbaB/EbfC family nucleoid-associated protein n=1 Tax=Nocardioides sp. JQ2195 TaxID=2592334 RepID=UPI00143E5F5E|nr:YbaB/EbfC family nucleoid-associated protein [Nocardioides sp. JQ2195]QIX28279.1 YbaB/EbfC family nucleoid-associated protein [Nocardioides sp. JQ2195]